MNRKLFQSVFTFAAFIFLSFGFLQLGDKQYLFADVLAKCCENGVCHDESCTSPSSAALENHNCDEQQTPAGFDCQDCMDAIGDDLVCNQNPYYTYCNLASGLKYSSNYGTEYPLSVSISGPSTLEPYEYGTFTAYPSGGISPYSYSWQIYYPCDYMLDNSLKDDGGDIIDAPPCGYWEPLQTQQSSFQRYDTRDFILKCTVTDSHIYTNSAYNTHYVTISEGEMNRAVVANNNNLPKEPGLNGQITSLVPADYQLNQNYPNPFNPATLISYSLKSPGSVNLAVYDISGQLVKVLVDEHQSTGYHKVSFNGDNLSSGVYIYRLETNDYSSIKKMILMK